MDLRLLLLPTKPLFSPPKPHRPPRFSPHFQSPPFSFPRFKKTFPLTCSYKPKPSSIPNPEPEPEPEPEPSNGSDALESPSIWRQVKEIALFAGPATGLWLCPPMMSLIDTMVIGQSSAMELAALGPGTVAIDYLSHIFMFLSVATSNMVATSLAKKDKNLAQHQVSMLLFVAFACGLGMLLLTKLLGIKVLTAFTGSKNLHLIPASNTYVQIRGFAWPAVLVGIVAQSASLGMKDSWGPLKALAVASTINGVCDVLLCLVCSYGIAGAAWATMLSQLVAAFMMLKSLNKTGFRAFQFSIPTPRELLEIFAIATPMFMTTASKVGFYGLLTYFATSMGMMPAAAHQVMINLYCMCCVWGEPLSQTAQSFMPELIYGVNRSLSKARMLLKSLVVIGAMSGLVLGIIGTSIPWFFPYLFTSDYLVAREMHKLLLPCFVALMATPPTNSLEGTLVASRDLKFFGLTMTGCFCCSWLLLLLLSSRSCSLSSCWWVLAVFQLVICFNSNAFATFFWFERYPMYFSFYLKDKYHNLINDDRCKLFQARLLFASLRLVSPYGLFYRKDSHKQGFVRAKGT